MRDRHAQGTATAVLADSRVRILAMLMIGALVLCAGAASAQGPDPDRYIVKFAERGNVEAAREAIAKVGGSVLLEMPQANAAAARIPARALQGLRNNPNIELIEQDGPRFPMAQVTPYGIPMVQADLVSNVAGAVKVCVIDSGFDGNIVHGAANVHEDLGSTRVSGTNVSGSGNWYQDTCGHGTHVAGTIMAQNNTVGVLGVTPGVALHIIKVFDGESCGWAYSSTLVNAAYTCRDAGADIISMSLGCVDSGRGGPFACANSTESNAFQSLYDGGILSVAAAGNAGTTQKSYPASYPSVISVAAVDSAGAVASFSQQNNDVELAAPGVAVRSTVPRGTGLDESLAVSGVSYEAIAMEGSPVLTHTGALVDCGLGTSTCAASGGKVCLMARGEVSFADKVLNCQNGGGSAAVIYNNAPGLFSGTMGGVSTSIPSVGISQADGDFLKGNRIGSSSTVSVAVGHYAYYDGTSMATPHVAGVAALVWSQNTSWTNAQIRDALQKSAKHPSGPGAKDNAYGYGLVQAKAALDHLGGTSQPVNQSPTASFTYGCTDLSCSFNGGGSSDPDGSIVSYSWNFGDGTTDSGVTVSRTYAAGGTYTVALTVTDNDGATGSTSQNVTVTEPSDPPPPDPDPDGIELSASAYKVRGVVSVDLTWSGATSTSVDIYRNDSIITTTANDGSHTDNTGLRGGGSLTYRVCEAGTSTCSGNVTVNY
jgi:serine protease